MEDADFDQDCPGGFAAAGCVWRSEEDGACYDDCEGDDADDSDAE